jgi:hypothetical protein
MITADELRSVANAQPRGYLKSWKAQSMAMTLRDLPIAGDPERLRGYVENCLSMEGFCPVGIEAVAEAIADAQNPPASDDRG